VIRFFGNAGSLIETHEHKGEFKEPWEGMLFAGLSGQSTCVGQLY